jgi:hypothetical protein
MLIRKIHKDSNYEAIAKAKTLVKITDRGLTLVKHIISIFLLVKTCSNPAGAPPIRIVPPFYGRRGIPRAECPIEDCPVPRVHGKRQQTMFSPNHSLLEARRLQRRSRHHEPRPRSAEASKLQHQRTEHLRLPPCLRNPPIRRHQRPRSRPT